MSEPRTSERGLRIEKVSLVHHSGELDEYAFESGKLNILTGVRNSSKTTTLKVIDYCLGDRGSPADALKGAVASEHVEVSTDLRVDGRPYKLTRYFTHGRMGKIGINGDEIAAADFSDWILNELGWPNLLIPKGLHPTSATEQTPLSFRNTLRHFYRNEDSWTSFADKEQEFTRRAVVSQLLGFARSRTAQANRDFDLARAKRRLNEAEAVDREVRESTLQAVTAISQNLGLPLVRSTEEVAGARRELRRELDAVYERRRLLTDEIQGLTAGTPVAGSPAGYDPSLTDTYSNVTNRLRQATEEMANLGHLLEEHQRSARTVTAEVSRMERLATSIEVFDTLPVRLCPACEQNVDPHRDHDEDACYLCFQPVDDDKRQRRAQVEIRSLKSELADLDDVIARSRDDLDSARTHQRHLHVQQAQLAQELNQRRAAELAPFMATLEGLAAQIAQLEHKLTAFPAMEEIFQRRTDAHRSVLSAQLLVERIEKEQANSTASGLSPMDRCSIFADRMNGFLARYRDTLWVAGQVSIRDTDLTFYVGSKPWDQGLGAEAKVLFFLAYSYATLFLESDLDEECAFPGLLLLDNPYQQGIAASVVHQALTELAEAAHATGTQVISTQTLRPPSAQHTIREIPMLQVYDTP
ncbi:hypothetical protein [Streptomyces sp. NBC_01217]|uniref:hypothetical protein n=1 Tax=Streptomyces sp. NBC_01217 TaxID=2903779 RepID=UPI002E159C57|nr:hypothetical protein OG507_40240 [Streptomyces sp. NBC_01217]